MEVLRLNISGSRCCSNRGKPPPKKTSFNLLKEGFLLPDLDSNQDKQSQSLSYYRYTIRQLINKELNSFIFGCKDNLDS